MKCPICVETDLVMADRQGVEIDYCPKCRGVWLDRGELDKIIERSMGQLQAQAPLASQAAAPGPDPYGGYADRPPAHRDHHDHHGHHGNPHKRRSWLGEIFD